MPSTSTDSSGGYVMPEIPPSVYTLTISFQGFATLQNKGVTLLVNQNETMDFILQPERCSSK
jgi:hypothetical protein